MANNMGISYPSETIAALTRFLFAGQQPEELGENDLVVVLGSDLIDLTVAELTKLWQAGHIAPSAKLILSGNVGTLDQGSVPEAEALSVAARRAGFSAENLIVESAASNTLENFLFAKAKIDSLGGFEQFNSILVVGQAFLLRRAKMYAAHCGYPQEKMVYYGIVDRDGRNIGPDSWWQTDVARTRVMQELERIATYTLKGDLSID